MKVSPHPIQQGKVRYVGDHVAVVVAETRLRQGRGGAVRSLRRAAACVGTAKAGSPGA
jgi:CO/xanthine dehydrogenase Mo-binding subunit